MIVIPMTVEEIRETYFYDALQTDEQLPMIHRAGLLLAPFDDSYEDLFLALHGWELRAPPVEPNAVVLHRSVGRRGAHLP